MYAVVVPGHAALVGVPLRKKFVRLSMIHIDTTVRFRWHELLYFARRIKSHLNTRRNHRFDHFKLRFLKVVLCVLSCDTLIEFLLEVVVQARLLPAVRVRVIRHCSHVPSLHLTAERHRSVVTERQRPSVTSKLWRDIFVSVVVISVQARMALFTR
ncbi:hypothetical protein LEP1GSC131_3442 [Leptospira kirschneri str. 200802841]|uniref:Uncharacterized protein n=1 Tax=Leptospira kirschneri str. 200802841 TaxID=1193047 RepID=A0A828Y591_9LEPT|nr:hypothetical protein LEP1GSC131_1008 [Leptospira kirschneri str. 200802841]EKO50009.1 hypothetical protein LEP1GSC131_1019 [Leptospira kirschneri str. 200802841]EKO50337.1 hypothetical protein LEP1GSC131_3442 [Leptospira kirschneri str. 200802841]